jgi:hypothetical protein
MDLQRKLTYCAARLHYLGCQWLPCGCPVVAHILCEHVVGLLELIVLRLWLLITELLIIRLDHSPVFVLDFGIPV